MTNNPLKSSRSSGKKYEDYKPRLTSAEKRAKRRLGYEPPGQVRRNSFVEKLDKKDPEDQSLLGGEKSKRRGGHDDRRSGSRFRSKSRSRISSRWEEGNVPSLKYDFDKDRYRKRDGDMPRVT